MAAPLLRRAFPSLAPLDSRSAPSSHLLASRLLPFSTCHAGEIPDKSLEDSYHSTIEKFAKQVNSSSSGRPTLPSGYPFDFVFDVHDNVAVASLLKSHGTEEMLNITMIYGIDPLISTMDVKIRTRKVEVSAKITPKPDRLHIHEIEAMDVDDYMGAYRDYLEAKGLKPETISLLWAAASLLRRNIGPPPHWMMSFPPATMVCPALGLVAY